MKKIGFHLDNNGIENVNCLNIENGNPGIGGSEYAIISMAYLLAKRKNNLDITLFAEKKGVLPKEINCKFVESIDETISCANKCEIEYLVVDYKRLPHLLITKNPNLKFIIWAHNFIKEEDFDFYSESKNVVRIVNVGREQRDLYRDHKIFNKLDYIYNGLSLFPIDKYDISLYPFKKRNNNVVYIGSIVPSKGFDILARTWPKVLKKVPDAQLYVIGSGKLYDRGLELGKWGIAESNYEAKFMKYLTKEGEILSSVHFMGVMGEEKNDLLLKCKVGVPNPSGKSETFGFTAIEIQSMGCNITTIKCPGYLDTVYNKKYLYKRVDSLASNIIKLLNHQSDDFSDVYKFIKSNFSFDVIVLKWEKLLSTSIADDTLLHPLNEKSNTTFRLKFLKDFMQRIKKHIFLLRNTPPVEYFLIRTFDKIVNRLNTKN
ncbi:glycosyltransferase family 4 protein [Ancylomarina sp. 16SWW S1-10-2]|uniref:glycosyltransferase family 4 protein n=1 Tax=Ancylomarina sp. 16SWW S1-10-2 TaxID=2499681 RepID=UPI0012AE02E7|nr:glycosyltransferase family 4 protein [Ancylomarina sp. 16SWW S1-10-2]MRT91924.1 glycosyltransferase [Ancylomarina sp. 16SWW S1-10-2]